MYHVNPCMYVYQNSHLLSLNNAFWVWSHGNIPFSSLSSVFCALMATDRYPDIKTDCGLNNKL